MVTNCHSCAMPLREGKGVGEHYCKYCSDDSGALKADDEDTAPGRVAIYMKAMPAWTEGCPPFRWP